MTRVAQLKSFPSSTLEVPTMHPSASSSPTCTSHTALLNVSRRTSEACTTHLHYKWIPVEGSHTADISSHFQEAIDFIDCVREEGGKVLIHCEAGVSRSPTICMAYFMKTKQFRLKEAFNYIKQRRSVISPNFGFMGQLLQYESEILPSTPTSNLPPAKGRQPAPRS